jgi:predicted AAA+ superfamily ATPase
MKPLVRNFVLTLKKRFEEQDPLIQMVIGPRQVGKTTGVLQFLETYPHPSHYVSADNVLSNGEQWLLQQWQTALLKGDQAVLVIDEIQKIAQWSEIIKKFWDEQRLKSRRLRLVLLGSSSLALSKGASESLAGRFELIQVPHWDYVESNALRPMDISTYLSHGGYPGSYSYLDDEDRWADYVRYSVVDRVIDKDILQFALVKKPALFRQTFEILSCYPSQEISFRKLLGQIQDQGNIDLVKYYISLFESAFLFKALQKYSRQSFVVKSASPKILPLCPCFYHLFSPSNDKAGFVFESSIGAKLLQLSPELYYWRQGNDEVDFVLNWRNRLFAIEVKSGKLRRTTGLSVFKTQFPDAVLVIVTMDNYLAFISNPGTFLEAFL